MGFTSRLWHALAKLVDPASWRFRDRSLRAPSLVRAGDLAFEAGRTRECLVFYGRAIDAYLEAGLRRKAEAICRRVIEIEPGVIRTRYTLAVIAVGRNDPGQASRRIEDYMGAVVRSHAERLAVPSLVEMASATANRDIRGMVAAALDEAGRPDLADAVSRGTAAPAATTSWTRAVGAALKRPSDVDLAALTVT